MRLPKVLILYTGGTFGMDDLQERKGSSKPLSPSNLSPAALQARLKERVPELAGLAHCDIDILLNRDSAHIGPDEWLLFARHIQSKWKQYDGIVLLHGTDTLPYTASALSFLLRPCLKPVVITGAQRPLAALRTDARRNLISAVEIAARGPRPLVQQVSVFFDDYLFQGNRTRKRSASEFAAFESPKAPPLAQVGTRINYNETNSRPWLVNALKPSFSSDIAVFHVTPGFPSRVVEAMLPQLSGLLLDVFPSGTAPTHDPDFIRLLRTARKNQTPIVVVTEGVEIPQAGHLKKKDAFAYAAGRKLIEEGCFWAGTMTLECAFVKASLLLGQPDPLAALKKYWTKDLANEGSG